MLDRKTLAVPVQCSVCKQLVTITYVAPIGERDIATFPWRCPHEGCTAMGTFRLQGELISVTAGLPQYDGPERWGILGADLRETGVGFLRTEIQTGLTFAGLASEPAGDAEKRARNRTNATVALAAVRKFLPRVSLTNDEQMEIYDGIARLDAAIAAIPA